MKKVKRTPPYEIQRRGLDALARELGPDGLIRFFQSYGLGSGDYTQERHKWLKDESIEGIAAKMGIKKRS